MYISDAMLKWALERLKNVHPVLGITLLVCKKANLPKGAMTHFAIGAKEKSFLDEYFRPLSDSIRWYTPLKTSDPSKRWLAERYPETGLQSSRTRGRVATIFEHTRDTSQWGLKANYAQLIKETIPNQERLRPLELAIWLFRDFDFSSATTKQDILRKFRQEFSFSAEELDLIAKEDANDSTDFLGEVFQVHKRKNSDYRHMLGTPNDYPPSENGLLHLLQVGGIGPAKAFKFMPSRRLNIISGDNGLGKSFLLDLVWWALSGNWSEATVFPVPNRGGNEGDAEVLFQISENPKVQKARFIGATQKWVRPQKQESIPGLVIYARVDGSFAVWDPAKDYWQETDSTNSAAGWVFSKEQVWNGRRYVDSKGNVSNSINGLILDWTLWQNKPDRYPFQIFTKLLERLSPTDLGPLTPGEPIRLPRETREMPTIRHAYGQVPIVHASAGVRRIVSLSYLIAWAWYEHSINSELLNRRPAMQMVVLIDEIEAHLHPKWQQKILTSLLSVADDLDNKLQTQFLITTHSPIVMSSIEPAFDTAIDRLFKIDLVDGEVKLSQEEFAIYGTADDWLRSPQFGLSSVRSIEAGKAIELAKQVQLEHNPSPNEVKKIHDELMRLLAADDEFWPRWTYFAQKHGVVL